jgi:hypothetical protein
LILRGGNVEEIKKEAIEKLRRKMEEDYSKGYERAVELVKDEKMGLSDAENLVAMENPIHEEFAGQSREFIEGFIDALDEMLRKAREKEKEVKS